MSEETKDTKALQTVQAEPAPMISYGSKMADLLMNVQAFDQLHSAARVFQSSPLVPNHMRKDYASCILALAIAIEMRENPVVVMQNIYFVHGRAGWGATYMIARANRSGVFSSRIDWRMAGSGKTRSATAYATLADSGKTVEVTVDMAMAHAEGWTQNSKYQTMPDQMLRYRSATFLIRLYCPEVMVGYSTTDELEDMGPPVQQVTMEAPKLTTPGKKGRHPKGHRQLKQAEVVEPKHPTPPPQSEEPEPQQPQGPEWLEILEDRLMAYKAQHGGDPPDWPEEITDEALASKWIAWLDEHTGDDSDPF